MSFLWVLVNICKEEGFGFSYPISAYGVLHSHMLPFHQFWLSTAHTSFQEFPDAVMGLCSFSELEWSQCMFPSYNNVLLFPSVSLSVLFSSVVYSFNLSASIILFCLLAVSFSLQAFTELPDSWLLLHPQLITIFPSSSETAKWCLWNPIRIISLCPCLLSAGLPLETSAVIFPTVCTM